MACKSMITRWMIQNYQDPCVYIYFHDCALLINMCTWYCSINLNSHMSVINLQNCKSQSAYCGRIGLCNSFIGYWSLIILISEMKILHRWHALIWFWSFFWVNAEYDNAFCHDMCLVILYKMWIALLFYVYISTMKQERRLKRLITLGGLEIGIQHQIVNAWELSTPPPPKKKKKKERKTLHSSNRPGWKNWSHYETV